MKSSIIGVLFLLIFTASIFAQVSPTPVINNEIRDGSSIRRRSMDLETFKRDADQPNLQAKSKDQLAKFVRIKEDFENIQKLENEIVQTYTSGKQINFKKIGEIANELFKRALRLNSNLFIPKSDKPSKIKKNDEQNPKSVRDLIVELDKAIGNFTSSPIFKETKLVDQKTAEKSQIQLEKIISLSEMLSQEAKKL